MKKFYIYENQNKKKSAAAQEAKRVGKNGSKFLTKHFNNLLTL